MNDKLGWWRRMRGTTDIASCLQVTKALQAYLDEEIDDLSARRISRHLELCRRCGLEAATYTEIKNAIARRGGSVPPAAVARLQRFGEHLAAGEHQYGEDGA